MQRIEHCFISNRYFSDADIRQKTCISYSFINVLTIFLQLHNGGPLDQTLKNQEGFLEEMTPHEVLNINSDDNNNYAF